MCMCILVFWYCCTSACVLAYFSYSILDAWTQSMIPIAVSLNCSKFELAYIYNYACGANTLCFVSDESLKERNRKFTLSLHIFFKP